jgi:hypothetical protein
MRHLSGTLTVTDGRHTAAFVKDQNAWRLLRFLLAYLSRRTSCLYLTSGESR